jgi:hypothetical protein
MVDFKINCELSPKDFVLKYIECATKNGKIDNISPKKGKSKYKEISRKAMEIIKNFNQYPTEYQKSMVFKAFKMRQIYSSKLGSHTWNTKHIYIFKKLGEFLENYPYIPEKRLSKTPDEIFSIFDCLEDFDPIFESQLIISKSMTIKPSIDYEKNDEFHFRSSIMIQVMIDSILSGYQKKELDNFNLLFQIPILASLYQSKNMKDITNHCTKVKWFAQIDSSNYKKEVISKIFERHESFKRQSERHQLSEEKNFVKILAQENPYIFTWIFLTKISLRKDLELTHNQDIPFQQKSLDNLEMVESEELFEFLFIKKFANSKKYEEIIFKKLPKFLIDLFNLNQKDLNESQALEFERYQSMLDNEMITIIKLLVIICAPCIYAAKILDNKSNNNNLILDEFPKAMKSALENNEITNLDKLKQQVLENFKSYLHNNSAKTSLTISQIWDKFISDNEKKFESQLTIEEIQSLRSSDYFLIYNNKSKPNEFRDWLVLLRNLNNIINDKVNNPVEDLIQFVKKSPLNSNFISNLPFFEKLFCIITKKIGIELTKRFLNICYYKNKLI